MEITLTKEQYQDLVKLVYLGNWMVNAIRPDDAQVEPFNELEQHVYSFAKDGGMEKYITYNATIQKYITNWEDEEHADVDRYIDEYDEENFWHELVHRLALRDFVAAYGEKALQDMSLEERLEKQDPIVEKYEEVFQSHGLDHLALK